MAFLDAVAGLGEEPRGLAHQARALQQLGGHALGTGQEVDVGAGLQAHDGTQQPQVMVAADEVDAQAARAAVDDGAHDAAGLGPLGEEVADEDGAGVGEPAVDEREQPLEVRAAAMDVADDDGGRAATAGRGASCAGVLVARPGRDHAGSVAGRARPRQRAGRSS